MLPQNSVLKTLYIISSINIKLKRRIEGRGGEGGYVS
jgi:hypothetical protein